MPSSIINSDDGVISGTSGLKTTGGDDGSLKIQANGTDAISIAANGVVTLSAGALPAASGGTGLTSAGTAGNVLTSNGTTWVSQAASSGAGYAITVYTAPAPTTPGSFTWTKPPGLTAIRVTLGSGGGGGVGGRGNAECNGGGGSVGQFVLPAPSIPGPVSVTVGAGGAGGPAPGPAPGPSNAVTTNGGTGGTSSFGSFGSITGGSGTSPPANSTPHDFAGLAVFPLQGTVNLTVFSGSYWNNPTGAPYPTQGGSLGTVSAPGGGALTYDPACQMVQWVRGQPGFYITAYFGTPLGALLCREVGGGGGAQLNGTFLGGSPLWTTGPAQFGLPGTNLPAPGSGMNGNPGTNPTLAGGGGGGSYGKGVNPAPLGGGRAGGDGGPGVVIVEEFY